METVIIRMDIPLRYVKGIGPKKEKLLNRLGVFSLRDLFYYFPVRYQDRRNLELISSLKEGEFSLIKAEVATLNIRKTFPRKKTLIEAFLRDSTGIIYSVWFNQPYLKNYLKKGEKYYFYGRVQKYKDRLQITSPEFEKVDSKNQFRISGIIPFYRLTQNLTQNTLRKAIYSCLNNYHNKIIEPLPFKIRQNFNFPNVMEALFNIHFPNSFETLKKARERFIFEELFIMQILLYRRKAEFRLNRRIPLTIDYSVVDKVKNNFGFSLTSNQEEALKEIFSDLTSPYKNARLLQGDVGCGKTIVVCIASFCVASLGFQVAFMVPTEVLALQHKKTLEALSKGLNIKIELLTSATPKKKKKEIYKKLAEGQIHIIVGTHSLLNEGLNFKSLWLIIIDEQHRFGVAQRAILASKATEADILVMSATPIPRSLALSIYGDLEISLIKEYPQNRSFPTTEIVSDKERKKVYEFIKEKIREGRQAYIIYALVEENQEEDLYSAVKMYKKLSGEFKPFKVGLLHGKLRPEKKQIVLEKFKNKEIDILISTLVVEVGIDIVNATVMVVENPERFGLAQLHQLRGRIMRSSFPSYFFMIAKKDISLSSQKRLKVIGQTNDGFKIAEEDLKLRGPGDLLGSLQAGYLPKSIASVQEDLEMLKNARICAFRVIKKDPFLELREYRNLRLSIKELVDKCILWQAS